MEQLITPRRGFLIRALGFTAAGVTMPIPIITLADAKARMDHHQVELEKAWRDYYAVSHYVRTVHNASPVGTVIDEPGYPPHLATSIFMIAAGGQDVG